MRNTRFLVFSRYPSFLTNVKLKKKIVEIFIPNKSSTRHSIIYNFTYKLRDATRRIHLIFFEYGTLEGYLEKYTGP